MENLCEGYEHCFDAGSHFLQVQWSQQLHYRPFSPGNVSLYSWSASGDPFMSLRAEQSSRRTFTRGSPATECCFDIPLAELVSSLAPKEWVFVKPVFCKGELLLQVFSFFTFTRKTDAEEILPWMDPRFHRPAPGCIRPRRWWRVVVVSKTTWRCCSECSIPPAEASEQLGLRRGKTRPGFSMQRYKDTHTRTCTNTQSPHLCSVGGRVQYLSF